MADFTGLDVHGSQETIKFFEQEANIISNNLYFANSQFVDALSKVWFSNNAVDFARIYYPQLYDVEYKFTVTFNNAVVDCVNAFNTMVTANGLGNTLSTDRTTMDPNQENMARQGTNMEYTAMVDIKDNLVGMDVEKVRAYRQEYLNNLNVIKTQLEQLDLLKIGLIDPQNAMRDAFKQEITNVINTLSDLATNMGATIDSYLDNEEHLVIEGAREANYLLTLPN